MKKYKKLRENTSKMLSLRSKIPGVEWDPPPIDRDHREAGVEWDPPPPIKGVEWDPPPINQRQGG